MIWNIRDHRESIAVITEDGREYSYELLADYCNTLAEKIEPRSLVFTLCQNDLGSLVGYVAFLNHNSVQLMLNCDTELGVLQKLLDNYCPQYIYLPDDRCGLLSMDKVCSEHGYTLLKTNYSTVYPLYDDLALLLTTSGSTGSKKFVRHSYDNLRSNTKAIVEYLKIDEKQRAITSLPMEYTFGLSVINSFLFAGASLVLTNKGVMQKEFWQQLTDYKVTSLSGVPYTFEMLYKLRMFRKDLPHLKVLTQAGGKLSPHLHKEYATWAARNGKEFVVMYGQTEASPRMGYLPFEKAVEKVGSMGIAIPGGKFTLIDAAGQEITRSDQVGELVYEGTNVTLGYAVDGSDLIKGDQRGGRLNTGDMAKFDEEGFYYVVGRKSRFLKIFGNRVNLDETERHITKKFPDCDCACTGVDDSMYIFIDCHGQESEIKTYISGVLKLHPSAFKVQYIIKIPKNDVGKKRYKDLAELYE